METYRTTLGGDIYPKQSYNHPHDVGYFQVLTIDVESSNPEQELHLVLTDPQGNMVISEYFKDSYRDVLRTPYTGMHALIITNVGDGLTNVSGASKSIPVSEYSGGINVPVRTPLHVQPWPPER